MTRARRALGPIAAVWLICQAATLTAVPVLLDTNLADCSCPTGADATCPMHHRATAGVKVCAMQGVRTGPTAMLGSLFSLAGLVPRQSVAVAPVATRRLVFPESSPARARTSPPDPPPPRARA